MDDYYLYPIWYIVYMLLFCLAGRAIGLVFSRLYPKAWKEMSYSKRANMVTYVLELIVTTMMLVSVLVDGLSLLFDAHPTTTPSQIRVLILVNAYMTLLYLYELIYRPNTNLPLFIHHVISILISGT